jgi:hypothetical protein
MGPASQKLINSSALFVAALTFAAMPSAVFGQLTTAGHAPHESRRGAMQALFTAPADGLLGRSKTPYVDAHGNPVVVPASYGQPCGCAGAHGGWHGAQGDCAGCGHHGGYGGFTGPMPMGAGGTDPPIGYDLMNDVGIEGYIVDQRGPHYFDARIEAVHMTPEETFERDVAFTVFNLGGPVVLSSQQLDFDYETGFRAMGRYDIGPLSVLEFGYMGVYDWESRESFTDPNPVDADTGNLFSLFSDFGTNPPTVAIEGGPMPETERSITQTIAIDADLQSAEMSYRRYWVGFIPRVSGTFLAGFRYTRFKETFLFATFGEASARNSTIAENHLAGFQTGSDVWIGLMQGVRIGAEGKVGIYNNNYNLLNKIVTDPVGTTPPTLFEEFDDNELAFISEASFDFVADLLPSWSLRAGYEVVFMNSILRAGDNFNRNSPYGIPGQDLRIPFVAEQGDAVFHGGHVGLEFIW